MSKGQTDKLIEKARITVRQAADRLPLPLHYILDFFLMVAWLGDLAVPDFLPFVEEILGGAGLYYYNVYLLKRTFGAINPLRIMKGESPRAKARMGLVPYEQAIAAVKRQLKNVKKASRDAGIPGLVPGRAEELAKRLKAIERRLRELDRVLASQAFDQQAVRSQMARIQALMESSADPEARPEYEKALAHAKEHLANIERIKEERNRMVATLERFRVQLDNTYSTLLAAAVSEEGDREAGRMFDELLASVENFHRTLAELEQRRPEPDLYQQALDEVNKTEARAAQPEKTSA